ncbi:MAG: hypothetical protein N2039_12570, partial [Gemmataceae bacterium]|nr:hypothetical protein [Gemmataceae bacterium]
MAGVATATAMILATAVVPAASAQEVPQRPPRFGIPAEPESYPQDSPKQLLASLRKAFERKRVDYVLAHLLDPVFADRKMEQYYRQRFGKSRAEDRELTREQLDEREKKALELFVAEVNDHLSMEPKQSQIFFRLLKDGVVEESGTMATVSHPSAGGLRLSLRQMGGQWFLLNDLGESTAQPMPCLLYTS